MIYIFQLCQLHPSISYTSFLPQLPPGGLCHEPPPNTKSCTFIGHQSFMMTHFLFLHLFTSSLLHYSLLQWAIENHTLSSSTFIINLISTVAFTFMITSFDMQQLSSLKNLASYLSIHSNFQSSIISSLSFISTFLNTILYIPIARRPRLLKREVL